MQVHYISSDSFYGADAGDTGISYMQYPPPADSSVGPGVLSGRHNCTTDSEEEEEEDVFTL